MRAAIALTCVVLLAGRAFAEEAEEPLVGARVRLTTEDKTGDKRLVGNLVELNDHSVKLRLEGGAGVEVPRASVVRVQVSRARGTHGQGAAIGFLAGALAGVLLGVLAGETCHPDDFICYSKSDVALGAGALLGVAGVGVGVAVSHGERWDDVPDRFRVAIGPVRGRGVTARLSLSF